MKGKGKRRDEKKKERMPMRKTLARMQINLGITSLMVKL